MRRIVLRVAGGLVAGALGLAAPGRPAVPAVELSWSGPARIARVLAADRLELADHRSVRLAGIRVPSAAEGDGALAEQARALVIRLIGEDAVRLGTGDAPYDRYGRLLAQIRRAADDLWLQGALLEQGLAQVRPGPGATARLAEMRILERRARAAGRGLWVAPVLTARAVAALADRVGSFQIVQGRVRRVAPTKNYLYLNFGIDWRRDFTVRIRRRDAEERFATAGVDLLALAGRRIEVRGLVLEAGGPLIEIAQPGQIEVLP